MRTEFENLETSVNRQLAILDQFPAPRPSSDCLDRAKLAALRENARLHSARSVSRSLGRLRALSMAAAVLLSIGLAWQVAAVRSPDSRPTDASQLSAADPQESLNDWVEAVDQSSRSITMLIDPSRLPEDVDIRDAEVELIDFFEGFDKSLQIGA